ncbi:hypothetical protein I3842_02G156000 [Carya illinoinensis]|uniref:Uncharacterized protein n=1 Tax=Carya illinoinensis TaxID=32201 RepID=A0A922FWM6_CARIL|nr:hypothetical protein I3842_02G156000 [Carya illinoinensis]
MSCGRSLSSLEGKFIQTPSIKCVKENSTTQPPQSRLGYTLAKAPDQGTGDKHSWEAPTYYRKRTKNLDHSE